MRVKLWARDGTILYSDEPRADRRSGSSWARRRRSCSRPAAPTPSSATCPSPRTATSARRASCWRRTRRSARRTARQVLFEIYQRFSSVSASASRLLRRVRAAAARRPARAAAVPGPAGLVGWRAACSAATRSASGCWRGAIEASDRERRRIAADLHDGVVQDLAGVAFGLAPLAAERAGAATRRTRVLDDAVDSAAPGRARPAHAAGRDPPAAAGVGRPGGGARRPAEPAARRRGRDELRGQEGRRATTRSSTASRARRCETCRARAALSRVRVSRHARDAMTVDRRRRAASTPASARGGASEGHVGLVAARGPRGPGRRAADRDSEPGEGTTVTLELRAMIRVLLADDHGVIRDGLGRLIGGPRRRRAGRHRRRRRRGGRARRAS